MAILTDQTHTNINLMATKQPAMYSVTGIAKVATLAFLKQALLHISFNQN